MFLRELLSIYPAETNRLWQLRRFYVVTLSINFVLAQFIQLWLRAISESCYFFVNLCHWILHFSDYYRYYWYSSRFFHLQIRLSFRHCLQIMIHESQKLSSRIVRCFLTEKVMISMALRHYHRSTRDLACPFIHIASVPFGSRLYQQYKWLPSWSKKLILLLLYFLCR